MGFIQLYCQKCGMSFLNYEKEYLENLYGSGKVPNELDEIQKSKILETGIFIKDDIKYFIKNYDEYGSFEIEDIESSSKHIDVYEETKSLHEDKYVLTHRQCAPIFLKNHKIAKRIQVNRFEYDMYLKIVFPLSISERNELINKLLLVYNPVAEGLVFKDDKYLKAEKNCPSNKITKPSYDKLRYVIRNGKLGKLILEKSEKISDLTDTE